MNKDKTTASGLVFILKLLVILSVILWGCSPKAITGVLKDCNGNTVVCGGYAFKVPGNAPKCGTMATFTPTVNRRKINAKRIK